METCHGCNKNDQYDPAELEEFMEAAHWAQENRRFKRPMSPSGLMRKIMAWQKLSPEDVAQKTGLSVDEVGGLLSGNQSFTEPVLTKLDGWLGSTTGILRNLQTSRDYFDQHGERLIEPLPMPDPRTVRLFIDNRPRATGAAAPA